MTALRFRAVVFDADSTLAALEGIDWLAEQRSAGVARECVELTTRSMAGELPIEAVYERRLQAIAPTAAELQQLATEYVNAVQPGAVELIADLRNAGCDIHIVSGGLRDALLPLATMLGIAHDHVHAVSLRADANGQLTILNGDQPLSTQHGKPSVIAALNLSRPSVMIGDGSTDAAARTAVDAFIAYTGVARRPAVVALASAEATDFATLRTLLIT